MRTSSRSTTGGAAGFANQVDEIEALGVTARTLSALYPGWWAKINLFAPGMFDGPVLYFDLDTMPVGTLDGLALGRRMCLAPEPCCAVLTCSAWSSGLTPQAHEFVRDGGSAARWLCRATALPKGLSSSSRA